MTFLEQIQNTAVDSSCPMGTLLRKCAVLAARLKNDELKTWVAHELSGYKDKAELPPYRILKAAAHGHLAGPFDSGYRNIIIPSVLLPEDFRHFAEIVRLPQPIAELEALAQSEGSELNCPWPGNLTAYMQKHSPFADGLVLYGAWQSTSRAGMVGVVDTMRNRVLDFALRLADEAPAAGEPGEASSTVASDVVTQLYHQTIIHGDVLGNVATGSPGVVQTSTAVKSGDLDSLQAALRKVGIPKKEIRALATALEDERQLGPRTLTWIARISEKITSGALKVGGTVTGNVLTKLIMGYLGS